MKIKSIELCGFKSFPQKTVLDLSGPTTAIVGPNGCGKSNIVDAVKWVIGETSMKELRGNLMEDVVFAGSEIRQPLNMAEVTILLTNDDGKTGGPFASSPEISLKRRYFRDGESEYFINGTSCRLKDIVDAFVDAGVGTETYSIIEQGKVEMLVSSKPEEKRLIIEEAAGIVKYKSRKNSAQRKMDSTRQNLLRINDILSELKRQILSITRQASKAEKYKALKTELDNVKLSLEAKYFGDIEKEIGRTAEIEAPLSDELSLALSRISNFDAELEDLKLKVMEEENELEAMNQQVFSKSSEIQKIQTDVELLKNESESLDAARISKGTEIESLLERIRQVDLEIESKEKESARITEAKETIKCKISEARSDVENHKKSLVDKNTAEESLKSRIFETVSKTTASTNNLANLERSKREVELRIERLRKEAEEISDANRVTSEECQSLVSIIDEAKDSKQNLEVSHISKASEIGRLREEEKVNGEKLKANMLNLEKVRARLGALLEYESQMKDFETPMKEFLNSLPRMSSPGKVNLVTDVFSVREGFESSVQAALGSRFRGIVVDGHEVKFDVVQHIKDSKLLRNVVFDKLPRSLATTKKVQIPQEGFLGFLSDYVEANPGFEKVSELLFGNYLVFKDLSHALGFWEEADRDYMLVTLDGDLVEPSGVIESGKFVGLGGGVFERKSEINEKRREVELLEAENEALQLTISEYKKKIPALETELASLRERAHGHDLKIMEKEKDVARMKSQIDENGRKIEVLNRDINENLERLELLAEEENQNLASIKESETLKAELEASLLETRSLSESAARLLDEKQKILMELNGELATIAERGEGVLKDVESLASFVATYRADISAKQEEIAGASERILTLEREKESKEELINSGIVGLGALRQNLEGRRGEFSKRKNEILEKDSTLREEKVKAEKLKMKLSELNLKKNELSVKRGMLVEQIKNNYGFDLEKDLPSIQDRIPSEEEIEGLRQKSLELKEKVDSLGEVNIGAIDELKELEERHKFLAEQKKDLEKSLVNLDKMIRRINQVSKKRFKEAFESINEKFKEVFPKLFEGGKAYLKLLDEENLLESGVDIIAQPPGKTMQNINLRSGGEKALISIALIIAVFLHRPSPFCFLDEVDAPLDDANILRFIRIIQELSGRSQFILITHNKVTMEVAKTLYGVTMEEQGVSKVVSVRFSDEGERRRLEATIAA